MTEQPAPNGNVLTANDVTALVGLMSGMLDRMEGRIIGRLDDNSRLASERWQKHDAEVVASTARVVERFVAVERELLTVSNCLKAHLEKEHDEDLASDIRRRPLKSVGRFLVANWQAIALLIISTLAILGLIGIEWRALG